MKYNIETKFNIGDVVCLKSDILNKLKYIQIPRLTILGIFIEICYGGTQVHYSVRTFSKEGTSIARLLEIELTNEIPVEEELK